MPGINPIKPPMADPPRIPSHLYFQLSLIPCNKLRYNYSICKSNLFCFHSENGIIVPECNTPAITNRFYHHLNIPNLAMYSHLQNWVHYTNPSCFCCFGTIPTCPKSIPPISAKIPLTQYLLE